MTRYCLIKDSGMCTKDYITYMIGVLKGQCISSCSMYTDLNVVFYRKKDKITHKHKFIVYNINTEDVILSGNALNIIELKTIVFDYCIANGISFEDYSGRCSYWLVSEGIFKHNKKEL